MRAHTLLEELPSTSVQGRARVAAGKHGCVGTCIGRNSGTRHGTRDVGDLVLGEHSLQMGAVTEELTEHAAARKGSKNRLGYNERGVFTLHAAGADSLAHVLLESQRHSVVDGTCSPHKTVSEPLRISHPSDILSRTRGHVVTAGQDVAYLRYFCLFNTCASAERRQAQARLLANPAATHQVNGSPTHECRRHD